MGVPTEDVARLLPGADAHDGRTADPGPQAAGRRVGSPCRAAPSWRGAWASWPTLPASAFTAGYAPPSGPELVRTDLAADAVRLARLLRDLLPGRVELDGLLALMLLQHSRRDARLHDGRLVLLPDQDRSRWHQEEIAEALAILTPHVTTAPGTPYLLQALVAAEHAVAPHPDATDWPRIVARYDELVAVADSPVVRLNRAVAVAETDGPLAGLRALEGLVVPGTSAAGRPGRAAGEDRPHRRGPRRADPGRRALRQRPGARPPQRSPRHPGLTRVRCGTRRQMKV